MKKHTKSIGAALACLLTLIATGCGGTGDHSINLSAEYSMRPDTKIEVGPVVNQTGQPLDIDAEKMLAEALTNRLQKEHLLAVPNDSPKLVIESSIDEYEKGDAFKRWLLPGWGSTVLAIHCDLKEGDVIVGTAEAGRIVNAGGGYTIGAWQTIFGSIADDLVKDLKKQMRKKT